MSDLNQHSEWLSLMDISGPFLAEPVLVTAFPQGLGKLDPGKRKQVRSAYEEWREALELEDPDFPKYHDAWVELILKRILELDEYDDGENLKSGDDISRDTVTQLPEYAIELRPDYVVVDDSKDDCPLLLIKTYDANVKLDAPVKGDGWVTTPAERMAHLCRATNTRQGLVTNGEQWLLVDAPEGGIVTYASWYSRLWGQEPITLQAFINLLGLARYFGEEDKKLPALLEQSLEHQDEVTETLGEQVQRAVEVLIQALDRADLDRDRELLKGVEAEELYEAGLTVMMRLVFLLCAEERGLLLLGDERFDAYYAVSTLRSQLNHDASLHGDEILSHRWDAWSRLLAIFRAVYGGIEHETLRMPALGGSLFDPDRFPFLEGRIKGTSWREELASPLPIDNRTVMLLLDSIQIYKGRKLSYRALDVEQIGYVYEGLLEKTVKQAEHVTLDLAATKSSKQPGVTLDEIDSALLGGKAAVEKLLKQRTGSQLTKVRKALDQEVDEVSSDRLLAVCQGDKALRDRVKPYLHLLRRDRWGYPLMYPKGAYMVTSGSDRRETGTHYTPKSLTEEIVRETLEPVVFQGPADGAEKEDWVLKSPSELLDLKVCDMAMGSGAFLVQVCRWLSERLVEAWQLAESKGNFVSSQGEVFGERCCKEPLSEDQEERLLAARRLIAERCLYGVDMNPLAVELAKLSIWLITLAKGRPFGFLDHNLKHGDSLLGIHNIKQLLSLNFLVTRSSENMLFAQNIEEAVNKAVEIRRELREKPILDIHDIEAMSEMDTEVKALLELPELAADLLIGNSILRGAKKIDRGSLGVVVGELINGDQQRYQEASQSARTGLSKDLDNGEPPRKPFHWALEFPEVFIGENGGFDAIVGNPPFIGGQKITGALGTSYRNFLVDCIARGVKGSADLVAYFFLHATDLIKNRGCFGLLAVNTIAEGDTRQVGLEQILEGKVSIYSAYPNEPWPGRAAVITSRVHLCKSENYGRRKINGVEVPTVSAYLTGRDEWSPKPLDTNKGMTYQGSILVGLGFTMSKEEAIALIDQDEKNRDVIFPYISGKDLNSRCGQDASRWAVCFWDWDEERAREYLSPYSQVEDSVKPERQRKKANGEYALRRPLPERWWQYGEKRPALYHAIGRGESFQSHPDGWIGSSQKYTSVICNARVSKYFSPSMISNDHVFHEKLVIFTLQGYGWWAFLNSSMIVEWIWKYSSRMKMDLNFSPSDAFDTLPLPDGNKIDEILSGLGRAAYELRAKYMLEKNIGLTEFNNRLHSKDIHEIDIQEYRDLILKIDLELLKLYEWEGLDLEHGFHELEYLPDNDCIRYTISRTACFEVLHRLALENRERHKNGDKSEKRIRAPRGSKLNEQQTDMFGM